MKCFIIQAQTFSSHFITRCVLRVEQCKSDPNVTLRPNGSKCITNYATVNMQLLPVGLLLAYAF